MQKFLITSILLLSGVLTFSQVKKDTLKTEEIIVEKPYTPTISDAFKITSNPTTDNATASSKEKVSYTIFSVPVASTFSPVKGTAQNIAREPKDRLFKNYILAGFGNYTSPIFEAFLRSGKPRSNDFGVFINHYSSQGGIKDLQLDDNFSDTRIDAYYKQFAKYNTWQINAGFQRQIQNYYGVPSSIIFNNAVIDAMNEKQIYSKFYAGGKIEMENSFFQGATAELVTFNDDYGSNEIRLVAKPKFEFPISTELINGEFMVDILTGQFDENYLATDQINYSFLNLGFNPNFEVLRENFTLNLGAKLIYANDLEHQTNKFYAYPNVHTSLKIVDDIFIMIAGVEGDLKQNSYANFASENLFVSPTLNIQLTNLKYQAYVGAKGKLASNFSYHLKVNYAQEENKPLFVQNQTKTDGTIPVLKGYAAGNSFGVVYDTVTNLGFYGELNFNVSKEFNLTGAINYNNYDTSNELEAWNLPNLTATISADYETKKWFSGAKLYFNSSTKDFIIPFGLTENSGFITTNDAFIDLNLNVGYHFSDRLMAFAKMNNALGTSYKKYVNYKVQSAQIFAGITYKFDL
ncbi:TonB-dependent receptor [Lutibacter sp.]|uniref:TonB-dependent receptor n=1 Tax=Lutibacter sp. TaxID=1925666 RepID=UPI002735CA73|nr:TonB-dependent receptor [Lutibacter sp.]MDP3313150.1 TonB-dependent receptor [Lutibacter sp.]